MSSSVDYRAFCEASVRELARLSRVYSGAEDDRPLAAEHYMVDHLDRLLSSTLTPALRTLYMQEYTELRAGLRAVAVVHLSRKDYYTDAALQTDYDSTNLRDSLTFNETIGTAYVAALDTISQQILADLETEYIARKSEVGSRLQANSGFSSDTDAPTPEEVVRAAMQNIPGVSNKGVSRETVRNV